MQYHAKPCNNMQNHAIPSNTMQYYAIQYNTMQNHASLVTADGAYHCPVGSIMAIFNLLCGSFFVLCFVFLVTNSDDQVKELGVFPSRRSPPWVLRPHCGSYFTNQTLKAYHAATFQEVRSVLNMYKGVLEKCS